MTEYPRKGDRVKVTYEGVVTKADDALHRFFEVDGISVPAKGGVVEVTRAPLPVGTIAVSRHCVSNPAVRTRAGWRGTVSADWGHWTDDVVRTNKFIDVIYEPPA